jgi:Flp pilus assembly protein TadG
MAFTRHVQSASRLRADRHAGVALTVALALPVLMGAAGFAVDLGQWYHERATLQLAADAAAMGAARLLSDSAATTADYQSVALAEAQGAIAKGTVGTLVQPISVTVNSGQSVTATLTSTGSQYFTGVLGLPKPTLTATATAGIVPPPGCVIAMSGTAEKAIDVENEGSITATDCGVFSNSDVEDPNNDSIYVRNGAITSTGSGASVGAVGGVEASTNGQSTISPSPTEADPPEANPYANLPAPSVGSSCTPYPAPQGGGASVTLSPGTYCSIDVTNDTTINFEPGLYIIDNGNFVIDNGSTIGTASGDNTGVTFYMGGSSPGYIDWENYTQTAWELSAPTSGTYAGILVYQSPSTAASNGALSNNCGAENVPGDVIVGGSGLTLNGALYMPSVNLQINNDAVLKAASGGTLSVVANTITTCGSAQLDAAGNGSGGSSGTNIVLLQ